MQGSLEVMLSDWRAVSCFGSKVEEEEDEGELGAEEFDDGVGEDLGDGTVRFLIWAPSEKDRESVLEVMRGSKLYKED